MVTVIFMLADGTRMVCRAYVGESAMDAALDNGVPGISARCGGAGHCTTCHCYVAEPWRDRLPAPRAAEGEMLQGLRHRAGGSRLSCQIELTPALDGIELGIVPADPPSRCISSAPER